MRIEKPPRSVLARVHPVPAGVRLGAPRSSRRLPSAMRADSGGVQPSAISAISAIGMRVARMSQSIHAGGGSTVSWSSPLLNMGHGGRGGGRARGASRTFGGLIGSWRSRLAAGRGSSAPHEREAVAGRLVEAAGVILLALGSAKLTRGRANLMGDRGRGGARHRVGARER